MPDFDPRRPGVAPDETGNGLVPDPTFWGPDDRTPRRLRHHRPGLAERLGVAEIGRDGRAVLAVVAVVALVAAIGSVRAVRPSETVTTTATPTTAHSRRAAAGGARGVVQVAGAVTHPGVVTLPAGARVGDALDAAGGALAAADLDQLNLAAKLRDGQQILVPTSTPPSTSTPTTTPEAAVPPPSG